MYYCNNNLPIRKYGKTLTKKCNLRKYRITANSYKMASIYASNRTKFDVKGIEGIYVLVSRYNITSVRQVTHTEWKD